MIRKNENCGGGSGSSGMLKRAQVALRLGVCERTVSRMVAAGEFPRPVKVRRAARWPESDVDRFLGGSRGAL